MLTVGGVVSLDTVTVIGAEVVTLPAVSPARAVSVWDPLLTVVVSHGTEYGNVVTIGPICTPSAKNRMLLIPTLSDALALTVTVLETVAPDPGAVIATVGGALSTVPVTVADVVWFPAASRATAVRVCDPLLAVAVSHETEYGAVVSSAPRLAPSTLN